MTTTISELRSTLEKLQSYQLPESLQASSSDAEIEDQTIAERYEKARNAYLKKRFRQVFYEHLSAFDGHSVPIPDAPSEEEHRELQEQHEAAQTELKETVADVYAKHQALQSKYDIFVSRREEIARMIADMEESSLDENDDGDKENSADKNHDDNDVSEQDLVAEEQKCLALAKRKNELLLLLARKKEDISKHEQAINEIKHDLVDIRKSNTNIPNLARDNIVDFETELDEMERQVRKNHEITEWNDGMRLIIEELTGISVLSVTNAKDDKAILLLVQLLGAHQIEIRLKPDLRQPHNLRVQSAEFLSSTIIKGASVDKASRVELHIPDPHDLVRLCSTMGPVEDLRFLLREAVARITTMDARVHQFTILRQKYLTKIGMLHHSEDSFGGEDQEVVCSINEGVTVVLRLTPDCPIVNGSVYVDQIVGVGGLNQEILEELKDSINDDCYRSPVKLMDSLKEGLRQLQEAGRVSLPTTPTMPRRTH